MIFNIDDVCSKKSTESFHDWAKRIQQYLQLFTDKEIRYPKSKARVLKYINSIKTLPTEFITRCKYKSTIIHKAIIIGAIDFVKYFIECGCYINTLDDYYGTPLMLALMNKSKLELIIYLLEHNAEIYRIYDLWLQYANYGELVGEIYIAEECNYPKAMNIIGWINEPKKNRKLNKKRNNILYQFTHRLPINNQKQNALFDTFSSSIHFGITEIYRLRLV